MAHSTKRNASGYMDMTAFKAMIAAQRNEPDRNAQLIIQKQDEIMLFIGNLKTFSSRCGYEIISDIVIRDKKTGTIFDNSNRNTLSKN